MKTYSSREAARLLGISLMTLQRHIAAGKLSAPPIQHVGGTRFRAWSQRDVERVRKELPGIKDGRKNRKTGNQR